MALDDGYRKQAAVLIKVVPLVAVETSFALKGGTAINLFLRDPTLFGAWHGRRASG